MGKKKVWTSNGKGLDLTQINDTTWVDQTGNTYVYTSGGPENGSVIYKNADTGFGQSVCVDDNGSNITSIQSPVCSSNVDIMDESDFEDDSNESDDLDEDSVEDYENELDNFFDI